ncbi:MAG TPA: hypothetical protein VK797_23205 [Tepidisphaeraceae bacterium]|nr:hypothetical protein [Tepidisphaeraceae bacterium]
MQRVLLFQDEHGSDIRIVLEPESIGPGCPEPTVPCEAGEIGATEVNRGGRRLLIGADGKATFIGDENKRFQIQITQVVDKSQMRKRDINDDLDTIRTIPGKKRPRRKRS